MQTVFYKKSYPKGMQYFQILVVVLLRSSI